MLNRLRQMLTRSSPPASDKGVWGENAAAEHLVRDGFTLLARNWRNPKDEREEIDLVMREGEVLVFVEVKARSEGALVPGYYAVTPKKKKILRRACAAYLRRLPEVPRTYRFDIVEVELSVAGANGRPVVRHFANVPLFPKRFVLG
jgi:putative endonuclease